MPDKEDLIIQLAGVRRGQRDRGRAENVSGYLVESVLGQHWLSLSEREKKLFASESTPNLRNQYESYLRRGYKTKEAASLAINDEFKRLTLKYKDSH